MSNNSAADAAAVESARAATEMTVKAQAAGAEAVNGPDLAGGMSGKTWPPRPV